MESQDFLELLNALEEPSSSKEQNNVIKTAANNDFTCDQVTKILDKLVFSKEQLHTLETLRPKISDLENLFQVIDGFTFSKEQKIANKIFGQPTDVEAVLKSKNKKPTQSTELSTAMETTAFTKLLDAMSEHKFPKEQVYLIEVAVFRNFFTSNQVVQLLEKFRFSRYRLKALTIIRYRIIDPKNHFLILKAFSHSSEQKKVTELLKLDSTKLQDQKNFQLARLNQS